MGERDHPSNAVALKIRCWDAAARELVFGREPLFIFDPNDDSNAAVEKSVDPSGETGGNALMYWRIYPQLLRNTFVKTFGAALRDPSSRVTDLEWLSTLSALRDSLFKCACGAVNYYDQELTKAADGLTQSCWSCGKVLTLPFRIRVGKYVVMLNNDAKL